MIRIASNATGDFSGNPPEDTIESQLKVCIADSLGIDPRLIESDMQMLDLGDSLDTTEIWMEIENHFKLARGRLRALFDGEYGGEHTNILQASVSEIARCIRAIVKNETAPKFQ